MEHIIPVIENSQSEFVLGLIITTIILFILLFITMINLSLFRSKYKKLNKGSSGFSFDEHILNNKKAIEAMKKEQLDVYHRMDIFDQRLKKAYSKVNLYKYNAFENQGGKLSFILVMLDDNRDGFILHNLHNNDFSYLYSKKVERGTTVETLTPEESKMLLETINQ